MQTIPFTPELFRVNYGDARFFSGANLFPGIEYGLASNPWAEILVSYGVGTFLMFLLFYSGAIIFAERLYRRAPDGVWKAMIALNVALFFFYFHRNTMLYQYNMHRQYAYCFGLVFFVYSVTSITKNGSIWVLPQNKSPNVTGKV
jgi:hypothetical protein